MQAKSHENKTSYNWNEVTLCNMLKNEVYIGNTVQNKRSIISYKVKKFRTVDKEEHIRVENTHEAIIDKDTFEKVQRLKEVLKYILDSFPLNELPCLSLM